MGLLDALAGQVLGGGGLGQQHGGLVDAIGGMLNDPRIGGIDGLRAMFEQKGLGGLIGSWIGTGQNQPISPDQLHSVLGGDQIAAIAAKLGMSPGDVTSHLSQVLPQVIDKLTPQGTVPDGNALGGLLGALKGALAR